jgi:hypothetical protein
MDHTAIFDRIQSASRSREVVDLLAKHGRLEASVAQRRTIRLAAIIAFSRIKTSGAKTVRQQIAAPSHGSWSSGNPDRFEVMIRSLASHGFDDPRMGNRGEGSSERGACFRRA